MKRTAARIVFIHLFNVVLVPSHWLIVLTTFPTTKLYLKKKNKARKAVRTRAMGLWITYTLFAVLTYIVITLASSLICGEEDSGKDLKRSATSAQICCLTQLMLKAFIFWIGLVLCKSTIPVWLEKPDLHNKRGQQLRFLFGTWFIRFKRVWTSITRHSLPKRIISRVCVPHSGKQSKTKR